MVLAYTTKGIFGYLTRVTNLNVEEFEGDLSKLLAHLNSVYQLHSAIKYKSVILGWNSEEGRFFVKKRLKNEYKKTSFKTFLEKGELYMALE